jgi:hypothetical protein
MDNFLIPNEADAIRDLRKGLIIQDPNALAPGRIPLEPEVEFRPPSTERAPPIDVVPEAPRVVSPIRGGGAAGRAAANLMTAIGAATLGKQAYDSWNAWEEAPAEKPPVKEDLDVEVGGTANTQWMPQQPLDLSLLEEKWEDVKEDRMKEPAGWAESPEDAQAQYKERLKSLAPELRQGYSFEAFTLQKNREQRDVDNDVEREARGEWAQDRQDLRGDKNYWQMKESMPTEAREAFDLLPETSQQKFYAKWYTDQRKAGMNPGDFEENVMLNQMQNTMGEKFLKGDPIVAINQEAEAKRLEQREIGKARTAQYKEDTANAKDQYQNHQALSNLFPNMPYAQRIQMGRMLGTAMDPQASPEMKQDAYNFLSERGIMPSVNFLGGGGGGAGNAPSDRGSQVRELEVRENLEAGKNSIGQELEMDVEERDIYFDTNTPIGDRYKSLVNHLANKGVIGSDEDGGSHAERVAGNHMQNLVEEELTAMIVNGVQPDARTNELYQWLSERYSSFGDAKLLWNGLFNTLKTNASNTADGLDPDVIDDRIEKLRQGIENTTGLELASNDLGLGAPPVIA